MYRISLIINEIYNKYLPLAEEAGITLNLDFPDPTIETKNTAKLKQKLDRSLSSALERTYDGEISISVHQDRITITDTGTRLSEPACALLSGDRVQVVSEDKTGTTVTILF